MRKALISMLVMWSIWLNAQMAKAQCAGEIVSAPTMQTTGDRSLVVSNLHVVYNAIYGDRKASTLTLTIYGQASAWYYVYAIPYGAGTDLALDITQTPPDATVKCSSADPTSIYVGAVRTTANGRFRAFSRTGRTTTYTVQWGNFDATSPTAGVCSTIGGGASSATSFASTACGFPPHVTSGAASLMVTGGQAGLAVRVTGGGSVNPSYFGVNYLGFTRFEPMGTVTLGNANGVTVSTDPSIGAGVVPTSYTD